MSGVHRRLSAIALAGCVAWSAPTIAFDGIVEKQVFELPSYTTVGGETIPNVRIGWESYGTLNQARDNAILITHYFSGTSHAAGKYAVDDPGPGYWDAIIGAGKAIDTDRYFVISSDTLVNLNTGDPHVVTTGPATIDPATGRPYGLRFPIVTIRDFVEVQKALLESLGITSLHAVVGASMGALQALEWASAHPEMVERVIPVIGAGEADAFLIGWLSLWAAPIKLDPKWNGGDYYDAEPPLAGLKEALKMVTLHAQHWEWADETFGRAWADDGKDPAAAFEHRYRIEAALDAAASARANLSDANHFLYLVKANQTFSAGGKPTLAEGLAAIDAPVLMLYAPDDLIFFPELVPQTKTLIAADGTPVDDAEIAGKRGHLDGLVSIAQVANEIAAFLAE